MADHHQLSNFIWQIADLLRGPYRPPQYERVMLPLVVLRRFDCVLVPTKERVLIRYEERKGRLDGDALDSVLNREAGQRFHNHSSLDFAKLKGDPDNIDKHLVSYINGFSRNVREIFERFEFASEIERMREANILFLVISKFCDIDLHPNAIDNIEMGLLFEDLIRRFNEAANETAGDHFTPREVIRLMVDILFAPDDGILTIEGKVFKLLDPACGTGGMLSEAQKHLRSMNLGERLWVFGQDFNPRSYAIAASDLLMKGNENSAIRYGDSLINDQYTGDTFDYLLANPPFGVDWKRQQSTIKDEYKSLGLAGRFGAGLPRVNDGALLFLQHMLSKFEPVKPEEEKHGSRLAIVFNGSPLFTGGAGSGESEIRKWIIENDWLEAIVALPEQMFYNTGIGTYIWIVTNRKQPARRGTIQLIDARSDKFYISMRRSLGDKRRKIGDKEEGEPDQIGQIVRLYGEFAENKYSKIFTNADFGYNRVTVERPLRLLYTMDLDRKERFLNALPHLLDDVQAIDRTLGRTPRTDWNEFDGLMEELLKERSSRWRKSDQKLFRDVFTDYEAEALPVYAGKPRRAKGDRAINRVWGWFPYREDPRSEVMYEGHTPLRDFENVRLVDVADEQRNRQEIVGYFQREVLPHVHDAWADGESIRSAYEINFNRYFYEYNPPRPLVEIDADLKRMEEKIVRLLHEVTA